MLGRGGAVQYPGAVPGHGGRRGRLRRAAGRARASAVEGAAQGGRLDWGAFVGGGRQNYIKLSCSGASRL